MWHKQHVGILVVLGHGQTALPALECTYQPSRYRHFGVRAAPVLLPWVTPPVARILTKILTGRSSHLRPPPSSLPQQKSSFGQTPCGEIHPVTLMSPVSLILPVLLHDVVGDVKGGGSGGRRRRMHINNREMSICI